MKISSPDEIRTLVRETYGAVATRKQEAWSPGTGADQVVASASIEAIKPA